MFVVPRYTDTNTTKTQKLCTLTINCDPGYYFSDDEGSEMSVKYEKIIKKDEHPDKIVKIC